MSKLYFSHTYSPYNEDTLVRYTVVDNWLIQEAGMPVAADWGGAEVAKVGVDCFPGTGLAWPGVWEPDCVELGA